MKSVSWSVAIPAFPTAKPQPQKSMKSKFGAVFALLMIVSVFAADVQAAVLRVVVVQTDNVEGYVKEIEKGKALLKQLGSSGLIRVWQARFAGSDAGQVVVSIEYADMKTYAADYDKIMADAGYTSWLKSLGKMRKVISDSVYDELKR
jgi:uncharacterized protein YbaA (DUF1428 family)